MSTGYLSRREFLKATAGLSAGALIPGTILTGGCGGFFPGNHISVNGNSFLPGGIPLTDTPGPTSVPADVFVVRGQDLVQMTRDLLSNFGGIEKVIAPGETVFIKPNFLTAGLDRANYT